MLFTAPASAAEIRQIEQICDRFEAAWQKGQRPRPESYLAQAARPLHETLLRHLVTIDWEYRLKAGEQPRIVEYQERFPLISSQVEAIAREVAAGNESGNGHPLRLGKYRVVRQVGRGGMGVVYEAIEEPQGRRVAIKLIPGIDLSDPNSRERFWREAHTTAQLNHANIVQIFEVGEHEGHLFMALEFVAGPTLSARLRHAPEPPKQAAALVEKLARAIQHAHEQGVVHRDLKPANVLLAKSQMEPDIGQTFDASNTGRLSEFTPKVTDFGLAHRVGASDLTATGDIVGTPGYMAPEQAHGKSKHRLVGPAADIYALGAILYAALTGRAPFHGATALEALEQVRSHDPVPPARLQPRVPRDLETICLKCLEKEPNQRYGSADALAEDLQRFLSGAPILARRASRVQRAGRWCRRNPAIAAACLLGVVALMSAAGLAVSQAYAARLRQEHKLAESALQEAEFERSRATKNSEQLAEQQELTNAALVDAERFRREAERLSANFDMERGLTWLEQNEIARGMLVLGHSLQIAPPETADLQRVIRINLAAAQEQLPYTLSAVMEQGGEVLSAAFSPDGKTLLTGGRIGGVRRWDAVTGEPLGEPLPHAGEIRSVAYSADGAVIASAGTDKTARLWDAATSQPMGKPMVHAHWIYTVVISPDGQSVLTASADGTARLWDLATGEQRGELRPPGWVYAVAFSPDGYRLATGSGNQAQIWRADNLEPIGEPLSHRGDVWSLVFSPDNRTLLTGSNDGAARLWGADTGKPVGLPLMHQGAVRSVGFSRDGKTLWTAGANGKVQMWNPAKMTAIGMPVQHESAVHTVAMNPEQNRIATGSGDGKVRLWEQAKVKPAGLTLSHEKLVYCAAFSPDGRIIATGTSDNNLRLWDAKTGSQIGQPILHPNSMLRLAFSPDGQKIITACSDNTARLWNVADGTECGPALPHNNHVYAVTFSPDGKLILTGSKDNLARLWDAATGKLVFEPLQHAGWVHAVAFSPDGRTFLTGCEDGTAKVWDTATGQLIGEPLLHRGPVRAVAYSPDGCLFVTGTWDEGMARLWDAETRQPLSPPMPHLEHVLSVAFSPDGKTVATGAWDGTARLWDVATCKRLGPPLVHQRTVRDVAFSPDGKTLLTASFDRTARCWDLPTAVEGPPAQIISSVQGLTGIELDNDGMFRGLDASTWQKQRELRREQHATY